MTRIEAWFARRVLEGDAPADPLLIERMASAPTPDLLIYAMALIDDLGALEPALRPDGLLLVRAVIEDCLQRVSAGANAQDAS